MAHKVFEVIGERVFFDRILHKLELEMFSNDIEKGDCYLREVVERGRGRKEGIFQRNIIVGRLDFVEPLYLTDEEFSKEGLIVNKRINSENPVLNIYYEINPKDLNYCGEEKHTHVFEMDVYGVDAEFVSDSDLEFRDYVNGLGKAGFKIF